MSGDGEDVGNIMWKGAGRGGGKGQMKSIGILTRGDELAGPQQSDAANAAGKIRISGVQGMQGEAAVRQANQAPWHRASRRILRSYSGRRAAA